MLCRRANHCGLHGGRLSRSAVRTGTCTPAGYYYNVSLACRNRGGNPRLRWTTRSTVSQHAQEIVTDFEAQAVGEWDGVLVTYNSEQQPTPIPDRYVPDAFRDWGVQLCDWQTQCSTWVDNAPASSSSSSSSAKPLLNKLRRLMPTVGCEADAIAYEEDVHSAWSGLLQAQPQAAVPVARCGSYASLPSGLSKGDNRARVELCVALQQGAGEARVRVRAVATLMRDYAANNAWRAMFVDLMRETYEGPYRGGVELSACAGNAKFSETPAVAAAQLAGPWTPQRRTSYAAGPAGPAAALALHAEAQGHQAASRLPAPGSLAGAHTSTWQLPLGVQLSCTSTDQDDVVVELLVLQGNVKHAAGCMYAAGSLALAELGAEQRHA